MSRASGPRIRTLKPECWQDERRACLSDLAHRLYIGLETQADDEGRGSANLDLIRARIFPFDRRPVEDFAAALADLESALMIQTYAVDGRALLHLLSWAEDQRIDKPRPSTLPAPPVVDASRIIATRSEQDATNRDGQPNADESPANPVYERILANHRDASRAVLPSRVIADRTGPDRTGTGTTALSGKPDPSASLGDARARLKGSQVQQVFDTWVKATGRTSRTVLDAKRRRIIEAALKSHGLADCLAAVTNIGGDEWASGANDRGTAFNDIEHALASAKRIEKWRDWKPSRGAAGVLDACPNGDADPRAVAALERCAVLRQDPAAALWLDGLHAHGFVGETLVLGAPQVIVARWMSEGWHPVIVEAAGCPVELRACAGGTESVAA